MYCYVFVMDTNKLNVLYVSYVAFVLSLFVPHPSFWCLGKAVITKNKLIQIY